MLLIPVYGQETAALIVFKIVVQAALERIFIAPVERGDPPDPPVPAADRAKEIFSTYDDSKRWVTIAVTKTREGIDIISSNEKKGLRRPAKGALRACEIAVKGYGHAEITGINAARELGLTPIGTAASRPICSACARFLEEENVDPPVG